MNYLNQINPQYYPKLLAVAQKITAEQDISLLCDIILEEACLLTGADGGTLYLLEAEGTEAQLAFALVRNRSLGIKQTTNKQQFPAIPLYLDGQPNHTNVASYAGLSGTTINVADAYLTHEFDFSGTRSFDKKLNYHTESVLAVPMHIQEKELVGVLQLLNAQDSHNKIIPFAAELEPVVQALASFAAIAIQQQRGWQEQKQLLVSLAAAPNSQHLLEQILDESQRITCADGGTLYLLNDQGITPQLEFTLLRNNTLNLQLSREQKNINLPPIPLFLADGQENHHHVAAHAALIKQLVNVDDAYTNKRFDFTGVHAFDKRNQYRSTSFLAIPLLNHDGDVIGVLQLVNARSKQDGQVVAFDQQFEPLIKALASYAAIALNNLLLVEELKQLLDAFVKVLAMAIDAKSPHTSGHCQRVPLLTELITQAVCDDTEHFSEFHFTEDDWYELRIAAWLHDCGKLATPDSVLDKSTKLHALHDRIDEVEARFSSLQQQLVADYWQARFELSSDLSGDRNSADKIAALEAQHQHNLSALADDLAFIKVANKGGEFMAEAKQQRVQAIAQRQWRTIQGQTLPLLSVAEVELLCIERGTLSASERKIINDHIVVTINMLESLPFPRKLRRVPEYAGGHHEKMDGTGYPRGLTQEQMSIPARIMAIADIFEALTAKDRPYKEPMKISQALSILQRMSQSGHIDPQLYQVFLQQRIWERYAKQVLLPEQLDVLDHSPYF